MEQKNIEIQNEKEVLTFEILELKNQESDIKKKIDERKKRVIKIMNELGIDSIQNEHGEISITETTPTLIDSHDLFELLIIEGEATAEEMNKLFKVNITEARKMLSAKDFNRLAKPGKTSNRFTISPAK